MIWDQLTSPQIEVLDRNSPIFLPIAATEQHGSHLPLATDRLIGEHFLEELNKKLSDHILILPPIAVACSEHHLGFAGTLSQKHEVFMSQVVGVMDSVFHHGFKNLILFNSHGGNQAIGQVILESQGHRFPDRNIFLVTWWKLAGKEFGEITTTPFGGTGHAGEFETSLMLHIAPELVDDSRITRGGNQPGHSWAEGDMLNAPKISHYRSMKDMTPNGIYGDPTAATAEKGAKISHVVVGKLASMVDDLLQ